MTKDDGGVEERENTGWRGRGRGKRGTLESRDGPSCSASAWRLRCARLAERLECSAPSSVADAGVPAAFSSADV